MSSLLIKNGTIINTQGRDESDVLIEDGSIHILEQRSSEADDEIDASGMLIYPGFIDCHVHFREPGLEHKANMQSESRSARAGGVTTVCEMPNTIPAATSIAVFKDKVSRASKVVNCDIRFYFGATELSHLDELQELWTSDTPEKKKCSGLKLFLEHSTGDQGADTAVTEKAFEMCAELDIPLIAHCEDPKTNAAAIEANPGSNITLHSKRRPSESEAHAVKYAISLVKKFGTQFQVAHLSTTQSLDLVRKAKKDGLPVTCEVTPHHLFLDTSHYEHLGTLVKMNPPLREDKERETLWEGLADGTVDCIATDHAPHSLEEKQHSEPLQAPSGVPGVETMIPLLLTAAANDTITYKKILDLCFSKPNAIFRLQKEEIADGASPDIVIIDPKEQWTIRGEQLHAKCGWTPFEGTKVTGRVKYTLRAKEGYKVMKEDDLPVA